jgi:RNA polymerase sigma-70 factor, ECF subfamily
VTQETLASSIGLMAATDEDVLENAVREHARLVYRIAYSVLRNHHDAEDATQETFVRVLRYRRKLQGVEDPKTWLARIAWRVAIERGKKQPPNVSLAEAEISKAMIGTQSHFVSAEERTLGNEMTELFSSLISALPEPLRGTVRLSTLEELTPGEIARIMDTTESSVRSRLFRTRQILKEKLASLGKNYGSKR